MPVPPILVLGNANVDLVLGEVDGWPAIGTEVVVERSEMRPGGSAGNAALALAGMGTPHRFIASVGDDPNGAWLRSQFDEASTEWIVDRCDTTVTVGIVHKGGDRAFFTTPGHLQSARLEDLLSRLPEAPHPGACALLSGAFLMPAIQLGTPRLLAALRQRGWLTAIDPGWPPEGWTAGVREDMRGWLGGCDVALMNEEEAKGLAEIRDTDLAEQSLAEQFGASTLLVVKRGPDGATARQDSRALRVHAAPVKVIDTVGAGDCFNAGFLAAFTRGAELPEALQSAVAVATSAISTFPRRYRKYATPDEA